MNNNYTDSNIDNQPKEGHNVFVIVPSLKPSGPTKGAAAICNGLIKNMNVTLVPIKKYDGEISYFLDPRVKIYSLGNLSVKGKYKSFRDLLIKKRNSHITSLSMCFHGDLFNFFMAPYVRIISSIRGNLFRIYPLEYGKKGIFVALFHFLLLYRFDHVIAMSKTMYFQLKKLKLKQLSIINNFIDEPNLEKFRLEKRIDCVDKRIRFVFFSTLSKRKRPDLLIDAIFKLRRKNINCTLDIIGDGLIKENLIKKVKDLGLEKKIILHGHVAFPYQLLQRFDFMVLPSEAEGVPRAVLESLFFSVPCILRDIEANNELIKPGINGELFQTDKDLFEIMEYAVGNFKKKKRERELSLLPVEFQQERNIAFYKRLLSE